MLFINSRLLKQYGRKVDSGTTLFKEGQDGKTMYVIYSGKVEISKMINGQSKVLTILQDSDFFGEMALLNSEKRSATAKTICSTELLEIDQLGFENLLKKSPEIALGIVRGLSDRLRDMNRRLDILFSTDPFHRVIKNLIFLGQKASQAAGKPMSEGYKGPHRFRVEVAEIAMVLNTPASLVEQILEKMIDAQLLKKDRDFLILENEHQALVFSKYLCARYQKLGFNL